jgi:hypothetical protein
MRDEDLAAREKLRQAGEMAAGNYHPEMEAVHKKNASRMAAILKEFGWPTWTLVGVDGEEAAWVVVLHSIGDPGLQRESLRLLEQAVDAGEAPGWQMACLADRIAALEGRPQRYGTHCDWDDSGYHSVYQLEYPDRVHELRHSVGLGPLEQPDIEGQTPIARERLDEYRARFEAWARAVGWRT